MKCPVCDVEMEDRGNKCATCGIDGEVYPNTLNAMTHLGLLTTTIAYPMNMPDIVAITNQHGRYIYKMVEVRPCKR